MRPKPKLPETPEQRLQRLEWEAEVDWLAGAIEAQREAMDKPARVFDETWVDENGELRYDFEVYGTGMSVREWEKQESRSTRN